MRENGKSSDMPRLHWAEAEHVIVKLGETDGKPLVASECIRFGCPPTQ